MTKLFSCQQNPLNHLHWRNGRSKRELGPRLLTPKWNDRLRRRRHRQTKVEERNANYWRIATTLNQDIPPAWVTHAARKRVKRAGLEVAAGRQSDSDAVIPARQSTPLGTALPPRGPFQDRVDRVFFFGDLNYRVDLSREDLEIGLAVGKRREGEWTGTRKLREQTRGTLRPGAYHH